MLRVTDMKKVTMCMCWCQWSVSRMFGQRGDGLAYRHMHFCCNSIPQ